MNLAEYNATKKYRDHLVRTVENARTRLRDRDFKMFAPGIEQEIARLDSELRKRAPQPRICCAMGLRALTSTTQSILGFPHGSPSIRFNSPPDAVPWTSRILRYGNVPQTQATSGIPALSYVS